MKHATTGCLTLCAIGMALGHAASALELTDLRCEGQRQPLAITVTEPRLSWKLTSQRRGDLQTAYQVLAASSLEKLGKDEGDLWDSGKCASSESIACAYPGKTPECPAACYWKVRAWDADGKVSAWSEAAVWEPGLKENDWRGQWINDGKPTPTRDEDFYKEDPAPLLRKEFTLPKPVRRARLSISGLGYYFARINENPVGNCPLDPGWTNYEKRVLYNTYDVTGQLREGANCIGVMLGNGWYNPLPMKSWGHLNLRSHLPVGRPRLIAQLEIEFTDGTRQTVVSDTSWKVGESAIRFNNIYLGEIYDVAKEVPDWDKPGFDDRDWRPAVKASEPIGPLVPQSQPPIRATKTLRPVAMSEPKPGVFVFDMGQNFAGCVNVIVGTGLPAGTRVTLRYGELLDKEGMLNPMTSVAGQIKRPRKGEDGKEVSVGGPGAPATAWQADTYIVGDKGLGVFGTTFSFRAFRYVEMTGYPAKPLRDMIVGFRMNSDVERVGEFSCSNPMFNRIQKMCDWTFLSNLFSVQSDCPHRERFAYGGDLACTSEALMMNYDMATFYAKSVRDYADAARPDGLLPDTAPFVGLQYCGVPWAMAHPLLQRQLYQYYGDRRLIEEQYAVSKRWCDLVAAQNPDRIIKGGLSDHEALTPRPPEAMVTPLFAAGARLVGELAEILGRTDDAARYRQLAGDVQKAYVAKFLDKETGKVGPATQASQSFALYNNLLPADAQPKVLKVLLDDIRGPAQGHLTTGIFGTKFMLDVLSREGYAEVAYEIVNQKTFPGWGYMLENGATTLWEHWKESDNTYSHNHPMFGSVSQWFYQWLGGIQPAPDAVGFDRIVIRPQLVRDLTWVKTSYNSIRGRIVSNWRRDGEKLTLEVEIPVGAMAAVYVPAAKPGIVTESGRPTADAPGVTRIGREGGMEVYRVGSGRYTFCSVPQEDAKPF